MADVIVPEPDPVGETCVYVKNTLAMVRKFLPEQLLAIYSSVAENSKHDSQAFWSAQGANGAALLNELGQWIAIISQRSPGSIPSEVVAAVARLVANNDGTVTVS